MNDQELKFCEMIEDGYLARDMNKSLWWFREKPEKLYSSWQEDLSKENFGITHSLIISILFKNKAKFDFIKWEDKEPWSIKELLEMQKRDTHE